MEGKYLPIGTVVLLKGGTKRVMITGFCSMPKDNPNKMYDYSGCMFPEGYISTDQVALFNHDQIAEISYMGLKDEEEKTFKSRLTEIMKKFGGIQQTIQQSQVTPPQVTPPIMEFEDNTSSDTTTTL